MLFAMVSSIIKINMSDLLITLIRLAPRCASHPTHIKYPSESANMSQWYKPIKRRTGRFSKRVKFT